MANHRIYRYTSLARPPNPAGRAGKVVLYLLPAAALLGAVMGWLRTASLGGVGEYAAVFTLVLYGAWAANWTPTTRRYRSSAWRSACSPPCWWKSPGFS